MTERARSWRGSLGQLLRGGLGLGFPYLLVMVPSDARITAPLVVGGTLLYIAARIGSLFEPETLRRGGGAASIGEAILVSLALTMSLVLLSETGYFVVGIGAGVVIVIGYLLFHAIALPLLSMWRAEVLHEAPSRPWLRRFVFAGAFVAEEAIALMCIALAAHGHVEARQGPWDLWDVVPIFPLVVLVFLYLPLLRLESAAHPGLTEDESHRAAMEGALLQAGAVLVAALTGTAPLL